MSINVAKTKIMRTIISEKMTIMTIKRKVKEIEKLRYFGSVLTIDLGGNENYRTNFCGQKSV